LSQAASNVGSEARRVGVTLWTFLAGYTLAAVVVALVFGRICAKSAGDVDPAGPPES